MTDHEQLISQLQRLQRMVAVAIDAVNTGLMRETHFVSPDNLIRLGDFEIRVLNPRSRAETTRRELEKMMVQEAQT